ncbi:MAG TPA: dual specificity protein phosphatase family protein [Solirubrobacteraceae bacterium]
MSAWFDRFGFAEVLSNLLVGAYPVDAEDVGRLTTVGVESTYNLCEDAEYGDGGRPEAEAALAEAGIAERRLPLVDYGDLAAADLERAVTEVLAALGDGERVYLHCRAGWQRSAAVAAGVIALRERIGIEEALALLRERKPTAEPMPHQQAGLLAWFQAR